MRRNSFAAYAALDHERFPTWRRTDWQRHIAESWVYAAQGALSEAVAAVDAAAHAAATYRRGGLHGSAFTCSERAGALAEKCGASTPALRAATERLPLTDREREIIMLLGAGLSSRAVADRLHLSTRTVENHVYRAMNKTGTTRREELVALLPRRELRDA